MKNNNLKINTLGKMSLVKQSIITAVCIALCVVFPMAFHSIPQAGIIYCPMHIPVLICGLICAPQYAAVCGISGVLLSSVLTGMPPVAMLPSMLVELTCYALISSLLMKFVHTKKSALDLYISLAGALIIGRVIAGIVKALIFARGDNYYCFLGNGIFCYLPAGNYNANHISSCCICDTYKGKFNSVKICNLRGIRNE